MLVSKWGDAGRVTSRATELKLYFYNFTRIYQITFSIYIQKQLHVLKQSNYYSIFWVEPRLRRHNLNEI